VEAKVEARTDCALARTSFRLVLSDRGEYRQAHFVSWSVSWPDTAAAEELISELMGLGWLLPRAYDIGMPSNKANQRPIRSTPLVSEAAPDLLDKDAT